MYELLGASCFPLIPFRLLTSPCYNAHEGRSIHGNEQRDSGISCFIQVRETRFGKWKQTVHGPRAIATEIDDAPGFGDSVSFGFLPRSCAFLPKYYPNVRANKM